MKEELILIGEIVSAVGIKGEVKAKCFSESPNRFKKLSEIILCREGENDKNREGVNVIRYKLESSRAIGHMVAIKLKDIQDRNEAERLIGYKIYISEDQLEKLPEDTYYVRDLIGLNVLDIDDNKVGRVIDVLQNTAQDVYVIKREVGDGPDILVPAVKEFVKEVNVKSGFIKIAFIEGMI